MRLLLYLIFFILLSADFKAQRKSWTDTTYFASGKTESVTYWVNNVRKSIAYFTQYKELKTHEYFFSYTGNDDAWVYYFDNGAKHYEYTVINNIYEGPAYTYYPDGIKRSQRNFHKNQAVGKELIFYKSGKTKMEMPYKKGKKDGTVIEYYENGKKQWVGEYQKDKPSGKRMYYDEGGKPFNGQFISLNENGNKEREVKCINGRPEGELVIYNNKGAIMIKANFVKGLPEGSYSTYDKDGKIILSELYEKGEFVKVLEEVKQKDYGIKESIGN